MTQQFTHLATLLFQHTYFDEGTFHSLESAVTTDSQAVLRNLGMILKPFKGGIHILASDPNLLKAADQDFPLHIEMRTSDPYYINYTQLPNFQMASECLCFDNLRAIQTEGAAVLRLQKEAFVGADEVMRVCNQNLVLSTFDPEANYTFSNARGIGLESPSIHQADPSKNQFLLQDVPEGILYVFENRLLIESLYHQAVGLWNKPLGVFELYPSTLYDHYRENNENAVHYTINFKTRKTVRKYFIVQNSNPPYEQLTIIDGSQNELFDRDQDAIGNLTFTARASYPLSNAPNLPLQLVNNFRHGASDHKIVVKHLAHPSPSQLYLDESPTSTIMYSHMYVYI